MKIAFNAKSGWWKVWSVYVETEHTTGAKVSQTLCTSASAVYTQYRTYVFL